MNPTEVRRRARLAAVLVCLVAGLLPPLFGSGVGRAGAAAADGALSGRVVDPAGRPVPGVEVALQAAGTSTVVGRATADTTGAYRVVVPQGSYDAVATTGTAPWRRGLLNGVTVDADSRLTVLLAGTTGAPARTVTFSGRLKDRDGNPVPGVGLSLSNPSAGGGYATSTTGTDGSFSFAVTPGRWSLYGYAYDSTGALAGVAVPHPSFTINLSSPLDLTADRHQDLTLPTFDLAVTVRDGSGAPVPGAAVSTANSTSRAVELFPGGVATVYWLAQGTTDSAGRAVLAGVPSDSVTLSVSPPTAGHGPTARDVTLTADTSVDLVVGPPVSVRGVLRDYDGTPIAFAPVSLAGGWLTSSTTTSADGSYKLSVGPGTWKFTTTSPASYGTGGFNFVTDPVAITGDRTQDLTLPGTVLGVHVIDPTGAAVAGASVSGAYGLSPTSPGSLFPGSGGSGYRNIGDTTDANGNADVVAIPASPVPLTAGPPAGSPFAGSLPRQVDPSAGAVTLSLRPKVAVRGVVDRSSPNAQMSVYLSSSTGGPMETATTAADGSYELHAPTGTYDSISINQMCCTAPAPPDRPSTWSLNGGTLQLSGETTVDFDPPFAHVSLRSYDEQGALRQPATTTYGMNGSGWIDVPMGSGIRSVSGYFGGTAQAASTTEATLSVFPGAAWNLNQYYPASATVTAQNLSVTGNTGLALVATTAAPDPASTTTTTTRPTSTTTTTPSSSSTTTTTTTSTTTTTTSTTTTTTTRPGPTTTTTTTTTTAPGGSGGSGPSDVPAHRDRSGYWMTTADGEVHAFGDAHNFGSPAGHLAGAAVVHLEPTPDGDGYWILDDHGRVHPFGSAAGHGNVTVSTLAAGEKPSSLSATPTGRGYWIFTNRGRVLTFGDATYYGDMAKTHLNRPIVGSVPTPTGHGYWLVASDGGIFSFGDAAFHGSTGHLRLNKPVMGMAPAPGGGYWLVASDGGIFAFDVPFHGSMGATPLNKPISGMVPGPGGYLMVAEDGGVFSFGDVAFHGSLGANPPASPVISVALVP